MNNKPEIGNIIIKTISPVNEEALFSQRVTTLLADPLFDGEVLLFDGEVLLLDGEVLLLDGEVLLLDGEVLLLEGEVLLLEGEVLLFCEGNTLIEV